MMIFSDWLIITSMNFLINIKQKFKTMLHYIVFAEIFV
ncbi:hypothetical protein BvCms13BK_01847 [Escherichia coli]|nr:hypothetical protein BvCms13BK_01847 [Escherichia coli]